MTSHEIEALFTRSDGSYLFARWARPIAPVVFGVDEATLSVVKGACEAVCALAGHDVAETDPELGSNLMVLFFRDWKELLEVPKLGEMIPDLEPLVARLVAAKAYQYRVFRFDDAGAIKASFVFLRMDAALAEVPAEALALGQMVQVIVLWSDQAFQERSALAMAEGHTVLRPDIADVIRAGYDKVMPVVARDASHALRIAARIGAT